MKVSVVIITLNEAGCIERLINEIPRGVVDEIVVVDANSPDGTADIARKIGCKVIMQEGKGYGSAIIQGLNNSSGDVVVLMDGDGSHNPKDIPKLINKLNQGYDCVLASRYTIESYSEDDTFVRSFGNWLITSLINVLFRLRSSDSLYLFSAIRRDALSKINLTSTGFELCTEVLIKAFVNNLRLGEVPSVERKRYAGESKVSALLHGYKIIKSILYWRIKLRRSLKKPKRYSEKT